MSDTIEPSPCADAPLPDAVQSQGAQGHPSNRDGLALVRYAEMITSDFPSASDGGSHAIHTSSYSSVPSPFEISDERITAGLNRVVRSSLPPVIAGFSVFFLALAGAQWFILPREVSAPLIALAFFTSVVLWLCRKLLLGAPIPNRWAHPIAFGVVLVLVSNSLLYQHLTRNPQDSTNITLLLIGIGCYFLSRTWFVLAMGVTLGGWVCLALASPPSHEWSHFFLVQLASTFTSTLIHWMRMRAFRRLEKLRIAEKQHIEERQRAEAALRESEERYALAVEGANDGLWDWNIKSGTMYFSPRWRSMLGYGEREGFEEPDDWFHRVHTDDVEALIQDLRAHLNGNTTHFENEHRIRHRDGTYRWMLTRGLAVRDPSGLAYRIAGSLTDVTNRKQAEEKLVHDAFHDVLTSLPNRALLLDRLGHAIRRGQRADDQHFATLFLDIDRFKMVNDSLGHSFGDHLLLEIAERLKSCVRPGDTVARLGGDEFVVLLEDIGGGDEAVQIAGRIQRSFTAPFTLRGEEVFATVSIGIALSNPNYQTPQEMLRDADTAMYRAKALGKSRYEIFEPGMHATVLARLKIENELRRAVERRELRLNYQPIVDLGTGHVSGFEALVRWEHPRKGLIMPAEFIAVAEETGMIGPLGMWVLEQACQQLQLWNTRHANGKQYSVSVNLSVRQFASRDLVLQIAEVLQNTKLDPSCLRLEITESAILENDDLVGKIFAALKAMQVQLYLDDFGTGYSSLSYLHQLPVDALKIDRSFVSRLGMEEKHTGIVHSIVSLARSLNIDVIAEGVETPEQLAQLRQLGCGYAQGYLFAKPLTGADAETMIITHPSW
jgi:diguanylate cyclase (GGDEF)-like protein/PAS domain S-box-containing protein